MFLKSICLGKNKSDVSENDLLHTSKNMNEDETYLNKNYDYVVLNENWNIQVDKVSKIYDNLIWKKNMF